MLVISALREERQDCQFKTSLGYLVHLCLSVYLWISLSLSLSFCFPLLAFTHAYAYQKADIDRREAGTVFIIYPLGPNIYLPCGLFCTFL